MSDRLAIASPWVIHSSLGKADLFRAGPNRDQVKENWQAASLEAAKAQEGRMTVWVYVDMSKEVGDVDHIKVFATADAAEKWSEENDPEGVAFEYEVLE